MPSGTATLTVDELRSIRSAWDAEVRIAECALSRGLWAMCRRCQRDAELSSNGIRILAEATREAEHSGHVEPEAENSDLAAAIAHRAGWNGEVREGMELGGYCVVCGVPWPCDTAKTFLRTPPHGQESKQ